MAKESIYAKTDQKLHDALVRLGLRPGKDFTFTKATDSLMTANSKGVQKLVRQYFRIKARNLHVSMLPNDDGIVETALITAADERKRPGFWYIIIDGSGRPVAEHPLTYTRDILETHEPVSPLDATYNIDHPPSGQQAVSGASQATQPMHWKIESHGDFARAMSSYLIGYDRVNDDDSAKLLEILAKHQDSPREIILDLTSRSIAQRMHDEIVCAEDDFNGIKTLTVQATELRERIALLFKNDPVGYQ